jgi:hypothetical protein
MDDRPGRLPENEPSVDVQPNINLLRADDAMCWVCGAPIVEVHCKLVCRNCGFTRDCSDP